MYIYILNNLYRFIDFYYEMCIKKKVFTFANIKCCSTYLQDILTKNLVKISIIVSW